MTFTVSLYFPQDAQTALLHLLHLCLREIGLIWKDEEEDEKKWHTRGIF